MSFERTRPYSVVETLASASIERERPETVAFEKEFVRIVNVAHAITFAYARHALANILSAAGLRAGDEVVLSPLTCKVVPLSLLSLGLKPVYADISLNTLNLDPGCAEAAVGSACRAILFQHTYGNSAGAQAIARSAAEKRVLMIDDCAQCLPYAGDNQSSPGSWGQAAIFSNNLLKPLPAGSGGVAVTKDSKLAGKIRQVRDNLATRGTLAEIRLRAEVWLHRLILRPALYWPLFRLNARWDRSYKTRPVDVEIADEITGKAHRVSGYQMRQGIRWLGRIEAIATHRRRCCEEYTAVLSGASHLVLPAAGTLQPLYYFPVLVKNKPQLLQEAQRKRIELVAWPVKTPIYPIEQEQDLYRYGYEPGSCPVAEKVAATLIGLPTHSKITAAHRKRIVDLLQKVRS
jgi:dTDP-4-amino-4,6-dideoxygalactose transaminase